MIEHTHRVFFASDVVLQVIDGEALVLKLQDETVFSLNETGARIAQLIHAGHGTEEIVCILCREYGADRNEVEPEVKALVRTLRDQGLVVDRIA